MRPRLVSVLTVAAVAFVVLARMSLVDGAAETEFGYSGDAGPGFWSELLPEWKICGSGGRQSPIDISRADIDPALEPLRLNVGPSPIDLQNNGHTIEQDYHPGHTLVFDGRMFELLQFHFHTLSEHTIGGQQFPMEQHAVFAEAGTGRLAVVALLYEIGRENPFLASLGPLPRKKGEHFSSATAINLASSLTSPYVYYSYEGSLTTPPCSETVTWIVLRERNTFSDAQFQAFRGVMGNNFRPVQPRAPLFSVRQR